MLTVQVPEKAGDEAAFLPFEDDKNKGGQHGERKCQILIIEGEGHEERPSDVDQLTQRSDYRQPHHSLMPRMVQPLFTTLPTILPSVIFTMAPASSLAQMIT